MAGSFLHGENLTLSRQNLLELRDALGADGFTTVSAPDLSLKRATIFEDDLFGPSRLLILEFFEKEDLPGFDLEKFTRFLESPNLPPDFVIWFGFELPSSHGLFKILKLNKFVESKFEISPLVFRIVDAFFNPIRSRSLFYPLLTSFSSAEGEGIFLVQMLVKRVRQLFWALYQPPVWSSVHPFVKKKLGQEMKVWGDATKLLSLYRNLLNLERSLKSGKVELLSEILVLYERA